MKIYEDYYIETAINLYKEGYSAIKISSLLGPNEVTIRKWIKNNNISIRDGGYYNKRYPEEIINKIWCLYNNGIYTTDIDKMLNLPRGTSCYLLKKNKYVLNHRGPKSLIKYENYFDLIDSEDKAYHLGLLMADGNVSIINGQYSIKIHICLKDKELIDKFLEKINSSNKTKIKEGKNPSYYVSLTSKHMCEALINYGVIPHKTGAEKFPEKIPVPLKRHFIRGVFDGDGITDISNYRCGFVGSKALLDEIQLLLNTKLKLNKAHHKTKEGENIFYFLGGKKFSRILYDYMYVDSTIYLERKKQRMQIICS